VQPGRLRTCTSTITITPLPEAVRPGAHFAPFGLSCTIPLLTPVIHPNSNVIARPSTGDVSFAFGILFLLIVLLFGAKGAMI